MTMALETIRATEKYFPKFVEMIDAIVRNDSMIDTLRKCRVYQILACFKSPSNPLVEQIRTEAKEKTSAALEFVPMLKEEAFKNLRELHPRYRIATLNWMVDFAWEDFMPRVMAALQCALEKDHAEWQKAREFTGNKAEEYEKRAPERAAKRALHHWVLDVLADYMRYADYYDDRTAKDCDEKELKEIEADFLNGGGDIKA